MYGRAGFELLRARLLAMARGSHRTEIEEEPDSSQSQDSPEERVCPLRRDVQNATSLQPCVVISVRPNFPVSAS